MLDSAAVFFVSILILQNPYPFGYMAGPYSILQAFDFSSTPGAFSRHPSIQMRSKTRWTLTSWQGNGTNRCLVEGFHMISTVKRVK